MAFGLLSLVFLGLSLQTGNLGEACFQPLLLAGMVLPAGHLLVRLLGLFVLSWLLLLVFPASTGRRRARFFIFALGLSARLCFLPLPASDDVHRYLWEGSLVAQGISPYAHPPDGRFDPAVEPFRKASDPHWMGINHRGMTAIYPPGLLVLLSGIARISRTPLAIKILAMSADMCVLWAIMQLLTVSAMPPFWALLYACNPLVLWAFTGEGHLDVLQIFLLSLALLAWQERRWGLMFVCLGLSIHVKYLPLILWPFFLTRENLSRAWIAPIIAGLPFLPFAGEGGIFQTISTFSTEFSFNGPLHSLLKIFTVSGPSATTACLLLGGAIWVAMFKKHLQSETAPRLSTLANDCLVVFGAVLFLSPTVHPWYVAWLFPFLFLRPTFAWFLLTGLAPLAAMATGNFRVTGVWNMPGWVLPAIWGPSTLFLFCDFIRSRSFSLVPKLNFVHTISVIIPVQNEAGNVSRCATACFAETVVQEVIVVDGGSTDDTVKKARAAGAVVVHCHRPWNRGGGRGGQIALGAASAGGDVLVVVHADTLISPGTFVHLLEFLNQHPEVSGGSIGSVFSGNGFHLRLLEWANRFRAICLGISFGDQVQFCRRSSHQARDLFPNMPLMEDVEFSLRVTQAGPSTHLFGCCQVEPRQWDIGSWNRTRMILSLVGRYLWRRLGGPVDTVAMYREYYRVPVEKQHGVSGGELT